MIITKQKGLKEILKHLEGEEKIFLIGCGECSTTCKTGGEEDIKKIKALLEKEGKTITGWCVPEAPCIAAKVKLELAKNRKLIESSDSILVLACGLGIQSVAENLRIDKKVHVGCDTLFMGAIDSNGTFLEKCSACGECVLDLTGIICPITRCAKGLLNGPCGGQDKGKCEVDKDKDCAWVLIYNELKKKGRLHLLKEKRPPKDYSKSLKPRQLKIAISIIAIITAVLSVVPAAYCQDDDNTPIYDQGQDSAHIVKTVDGRVVSVDPSNAQITVKTIEILAFKVPPTATLTNKDGFNIQLSDIKTGNYVMVEYYDERSGAHIVRSINAEYNR